MNRPALRLARCLGLVTLRALMSGPVPPAAAAAVLLALAQAPAHAADLLVGNQGQPTAEREGVDWGKREYGWAQLSGMFNRGAHTAALAGLHHGPERRGLPAGECPAQHADSRAWRGALVWQSRADGRHP